MLKKAIVATTLLFSLSTACWSSGAYVGVSTGPEMDAFNQDSTVTQPGNFNVTDKTHTSANGAFGSLFAGYGWKHKRFYLAGEVNTNFTSAQFESTNNEILHSSFVNTTYKVDQRLGLSVLPGFILTQSTILYGRLGYALGYFHITTGDTSLAKTNQSINGFRYGVGIKQAIAKQLSLIVEFNRTNYQRTSLYVVDGTVKKNTNISPVASQAQIGIAYDFA